MRGMKRGAVGTGKLAQGTYLSFSALSKRCGDLPLPVKKVAVGR